MRSLTTASFLARVGAPALVDLGGCRGFEGPGALGGSATHMRTTGQLFPRLCDADHLDRAAKLTVRGKRRRPDVAWFLFRRDQELARLATELADGTWKPLGFELLTIRDPKPRLIARAPIADRVVHSALTLLLEPVFLPSLSAAAYSCRPGFGTHRAVLRLRELMNQHRFVLHLDVRSYFPSVDLSILSRLLARRIRDPRFLAVLAAVLETGPRLYEVPEARAWAGLAADWPPPGRGLPIGTSTSQLFASHVYLAELDHWLQRELKVPGYLRYVDDLFLFGDRRADLRSWRSQAGGWLQEHRHLLLKHPEARVLSCRGHLDALGYRIRREQLNALPRALRRLAGRVATEMGRLPGQPRRVDLARSIAATAGVVLF